MVTKKDDKQTFDHKKLGPLPRILKNMTPEQRAGVLEYYKGMSLPELRTRQDITKQQLKWAVQQQNEGAISNQEVTQGLLDQAVMEVYCPEPDPFKDSRYPGLVALAKELADEICQKINVRAPLVDADTPYKQQGTLEYLIKILQERV